MVDHDARALRSDGVTQLPSRYQPHAGIERRFGARVRRLGSMLVEGDPLADAVVTSLASLPHTQRAALIDTALRSGIDAVPEAPAALRALFAQLDTVPFWFDPQRADRGGAVLLRAGPLGGLVLGTRSLIAGYCSPAGNKPLIFSQRLQYDTRRRLIETSRFVQETSRRNGMTRRGYGFRAAVKVRLMHAQVRRILCVHPEWKASEWGTPINQFDMAGTVLLFSFALTDGLRKLGVPVRDDEMEDNLHLWRYVGWLMGVREELLCTSVREAEDLVAMLRCTQGPPDRDSRTLAHAMLRGPVAYATTPRERARAERVVAFSYAVSRYLVTDDFADALEFPHTLWRASIPALRLAVSSAESVRRSVPGLERIAEGAGLSYWERVVQGGLEGRAITFEMPERLGSNAS